MGKGELIIREFKKDDAEFLHDALYDAIFIPAGEKKPPREIVDQPELNRYISNFGREGDFCLVAELNEELVGITWIRIFTESEKGYGFVDENTPELSMSVSEKYRKKGIGGRLLKSMIIRLDQESYQQISLSVDKANYAYGFYKDHGFVDYSEKGGSITMIRKKKNVR